jgi:outer membrane protein assembly factor BamB
MRIRWVVVVVASALVVGGCDWTMFMGGVAHSGSNGDTSISVAAVTTGLSEKWEANLNSIDQTDTPSSPVVAKGFVYIGTQNGHLDAFQADGTHGCNAETPKHCQPLWSTGTISGGFTSTPAVANGVVYIGGTDGFLYAFDAAGSTNCSGLPKICAPLWTSSLVGAIEASPVVANGKVYIGADDHAIYAFDAAGVTRCSATTCSPLFVDITGNKVGSSPAVVGNILYAGSDDGKLYAFDATGSQGCNASGVCQPLWVGPTAGSVRSSPSVVQGRVFVGSDDGKLYAFDAAGSTNCSGSPKTCLPLWTAQTANQVDSSPAVADGVVYIGTTAGGSTGARLNAFDAAGVTNCSGAPKTCQPLWTSGALGTVGQSPISVDDGVVYIDIAVGLFSFQGSVFMFDATAPATHCSGSPKVCTPLSSVTAAAGDGLDSAPAVANGFLYVAGDNLYAYAP